MGELVNHVEQRVVVQAIITWLVCLVLTMMVEDEGFMSAFYAVASVLFWGGSFVYFHSRPYFGSTDLLAFRVAPIGFFFVGMLSGSILG